MVHFLHNRSSSPKPPNSILFSGMKIILKSTHVPALPARGSWEIQSLSRTQDRGIRTHCTVQGDSSGLLSCHFLLSLAVTSPAALAALLLIHGGHFCKGPHHKHLRLCGPHMVSAAYSRLFQPFKHIKPILSLTAAQSHCVLDVARGMCSPTPGEARKRDG